MKRKILLLFLALALLIASVPMQANAVSDVCFVAINDTLPETIPFAYINNSVVYIPCSALNSFRVYSLYDSGISTVLIYTSSQQITIDMNAGIATDIDGIQYSVTAIYRNGQVYVPAQFICSMFGLRASYIEGVGMGDICRITDGSEVLGDSLFLSAATNLMRTRYNAYQQSIAATPTPTPNGAGQNQGQRRSTIYLTFLGLPTSYLLNLLKNYGYTGTFFLSAADIADSPETVRRIVGEGHNVGIYCQNAALWEVDQTSELLFEAAHVKTVLVTAGTGASQAFSQECQQEGFVECRYDINGISGKNGVGITSAAGVIHHLNDVKGDNVFMLALTQSNDTAVRSIITHLYSNPDHFTVDTVCEVGYTGGKSNVD